MGIFQNPIDLAMGVNNNAAAAGGGVGAGTGGVSEAAAERNVKIDKVVITSVASTTTFFPIYNYFYENTNTNQKQKQKQNHTNKQ